MRPGARRRSPRHARAGARGFRASRNTRRAQWAGAPSARRRRRAIRAAVAVFDSALASCRVVSCRLGSARLGSPRGVFAHAPAGSHAP
ncbi:hypothetical protein AQ930_30725 [Burkholderia pseudomallei]|nr:hypothetical protein AQ928_26800 [Burkholderia pseudomallei]OND26138.1 hypothetical protein AQ929_01715 [Burkholderia pseudomallei]OND27761.1 hypothetical protein AQ930_30725 [Burkholderia pseudomallei]